MSGLIVAAVITATLALGAGGTVLVRAAADRSERAFLLVLLVLCLPLQPASLFLFRFPVVDAMLMRPWLQGRHGEAYLLAQSLYAPLTEEPFKLLPWILLPLRRRLTPANAAAAAAAVGIGFGIGEIGTIAWLLRASPIVVGVPFWQFGGLVVERLAVCICHGGFTLAFVWLLAGGRNPWPGFALGVLAHFLGNAPILFAALDPFGLPRAAWSVLLQLWLGIWVIGALAGFARARPEAQSLGRLLFGQARCPRCAVVYDRPALAMNLGVRRYERCPACRTWNLTTPLGPTR